MFAVLYRWRVDPSKESQFVENWSVITRHFVDNCHSMGSRLHRGSDGIYYGYAQWPSQEILDNAFSDFQTELARLQMREAVTESFPEIRFQIVEDHLVFPAAFSS